MRRSLPTLNLFTEQNARAPGREPNTGNELPARGGDKGAEVRLDSEGVQGVEDIDEDAVSDVEGWTGCVPGSIDYFAAEQRRLKEAGMKSATEYWRLKGITWPRS